jgi:hypothetical protein
MAASPAERMRKYRARLTLKRAARNAMNYGVIPLECVTLVEAMASAWSLERAARDLAPRPQPVTQIAVTAPAAGAHRNARARYEPLPLP